MQIGQPAFNFGQLTREVLLNGTESALDKYFENLNHAAVFFGANIATAVFENREVVEFMRSLASVYYFHF